MGVSSFKSGSGPLEVGAGIGAKNCFRYLSKLGDSFLKGVIEHSVRKRLGCRNYPKMLPQTVVTLAPCQRLCIAYLCTQADNGPFHLAHS
jgi:hypothetical protein